MGAHKRKSKNGLPRMARNERQYYTRALHEATHAVVAEAVGLRIDYVQIFTETDSEERQIIKMSGTGGVTYPNKDSLLTQLEKGEITPELTCLLSAGLCEGMITFTDKSLIDVHCSRDKQMIEDRTAENPSKVEYFIAEGDGSRSTLTADDGTVVTMVSRPVPQYEFDADMLLHTPSIQQAIFEVADSLVERRGISGGDVRAILREALERFAEDDAKSPYCCRRLKLTDRGVRAIAENERTQIDSGGTRS